MSIFKKPNARGEKCCWCDGQATHCLATVLGDLAVVYEPACPDHLNLAQPPNDQARLYRLPRL